MLFCLHKKKCYLELFDLWFGACFPAYNWFNTTVNGKKRKENINHGEICSFPNLVLNRGEENLQAGGNLSHQVSEILVAKNGGKRGEAGGESQEKVQVTLFFFLETNSGWTQGDARQFTKSQALLSHFSKPCNLETGPQPTIASSSQTFINLVKIPKCLLAPSPFFFVKTCAKLWLIRMKCQWITVNVELRKMVLPPYWLCVYFQLSTCLWMQQHQQTKWKGSLNNLKDSLKVVFTDKVILDILFYFLPWKAVS